MTSTVWTRKDMLSVVEELTEWADDFLGQVSLSDIENEKEVSLGSPYEGLDILVKFDKRKVQEDVYYWVTATALVLESLTFSRKDGVVVLDKAMFRKKDRAKETDEYMPQSIVASRTVTFDVQRVMEDYFHDHDSRPSWAAIKDVIIDRAIEDLTVFGVYDVPIMLHDENGEFIEEIR